jgi:hypothetical protein
MPRYKRRPFFEKIGKKELIIQLTRKPWHSWWIWCRSHKVDAYSVDALKLWIDGNIRERERERLIQEATGKHWKEWLDWCNRNKVDLYSGEAVNLWYQKHSSQKKIN